MNNTALDCICRRNLDIDPTTTRCLMYRGKVAPKNVHAVLPDLMNVKWCVRYRGDVVLKDFHAVVAVIKTKHTVQFVESPAFPSKNSWSPSQRLPSQLSSRRKRSSLLWLAT